MAYHTTRMFIKVKDDSTWNKFREAMLAEKLENIPSAFREFLSVPRTNSDQFVLTDWHVTVYDADKFVASLCKAAPEEFMLLSDTDCSINEGIGACWYFGYDDISHGGEPIIVDCFEYELNKDYLEYDVDDFRGEGMHPAMMITSITHIDDPVDWIRYGIGTGMIELEEEEAEFLKQMGYEFVSFAAERQEAQQKRIEEWMNKYGKDLNPKAEIIVKDKIYVFTGVKGCYEWPAILNKFTEMGGIQRNTVSGKTDYLVCEPLFAGDSQINKAKEQSTKGKDIKIVLLDDFLEAIGLDLDALEDEDDWNDEDESNFEYLL